MLRDLPARFEYLYDFGDSWEHEVEVVGRGGDSPGCVEGEGGCPPEDCGGAPGYEHLLEVLADPGHDEHEHLRVWAGKLPSFDREATSLLIRQTVGEVPESVRIVLDLLGDGMKLTPGGRLPRSVVRAVQERRPEWHSSTGRRRSRRTCLHWPRCTMSCARSGWLGRRAGC